MIYSASGSRFSLGHGIHVKLAPIFSTSRSLCRRRFPNDQYIEKETFENEQAQAQEAEEEDKSFEKEIRQIDASQPRYILHQYRVDSIDDHMWAWNKGLEYSGEWRSDGWCTMNNIIYQRDAFGIIQVNKATAFGRCIEGHVTACGHAGLYMASRGECSSGGHRWYLMVDAIY